MDESSHDYRLPRLPFDRRRNFVLVPMLYTMTKPMRVGVRNIVGSDVPPPQRAQCVTHHTKNQSSCQLKSKASR